MQAGRELISKTSGHPKRDAPDGRTLMTIAQQVTSLREEPVSNGRLQREKCRASQRPLRCAWPMATCLLVAVIAGCAQPEEEVQVATPPPEEVMQQGEMGDYSSFADEYLEATKTLDPYLPEGVEFPPAVYGDFEPDAQFEEGVGAMQAAFFAQCAWLRAYADARAIPDESGANLALQQLKDWVYLPLVSDSIDSVSAEAWAESITVVQQGGDDEGLVSMAENCYSEAS